MSNQDHTSTIQSIQHVQPCTKCALCILMNWLDDTDSWKYEQFHSIISIPQNKQYKMTGNSRTSLYEGWRKTDGNGMQQNKNNDRAKSNGTHILSRAEKS